MAGSGVGFDGDWKDEEGKIITIAGSALWIKGKEVAPVLITENRCSFEMDGEVFHGLLCGGNHLAWSDGTIWVRPVPGHDNIRKATVAAALQNWEENEERQARAQEAKELEERERLAAEIARKAEAARREQEAREQEAKKLEERVRLAAEIARKAEADKREQEAKELEERERLAAEIARKAEADKCEQEAREQEAKKQEERVRLAAEIARKAEADKREQEAKTLEERERLAAEIARKAEADKIKAEAEAEEASNDIGRRLSESSAQFFDLAGDESEDESQAEKEKLACEQDTKAQKDWLTDEFSQAEMKRLIQEAKKTEEDRSVGERANAKHERLAKAAAGRVLAETDERMEAERHFFGSAAAEVDSGRSVRPEENRSVLPEQEPTKEDAVPTLDEILAQLARDEAEEEIRNREQTRALAEQAEVRAKKKASASKAGDAFIAQYVPKKQEHVAVYSGFPSSRSGELDAPRRKNPARAQDDGTKQQVAYHTSGNAPQSLQPRQQTQNIPSVDDARRQQDVGKTGFEGRWEEFRANYQSADARAPPTSIKEKIQASNVPATSHTKPAEEEPKPRVRKGAFSQLKEKEQEHTAVYSARNSTSRSGEPDAPQQQSTARAQDAEAIAKAAAQKAQDETMKAMRLAITAEQEPTQDDNVPSIEELLAQLARDEDNEAPDEEEATEKDTKTGARQTSSSSSSLPYSATPQAQAGLSEGMRVRLKGFEAKPELNGTFGIIIERDEENGKWQVQLEKSGRKMLLKEQHIEGVTGPTEDVRSTTAMESTQDMEAQMLATARIQR